MLDPKHLRDHAEAVEKELAKRGAAFPLNPFMAADEERRRLIAELEQLKARQNRASEAIARAKREQRPIAEILTSMKQIAEETARLSEELRSAEKKWRQEILTLPNIPHPSVPVGREPSENKEVRRWGEPQQFPFPVRPHEELGEALGILDFARAAKIAGARFALYKGAGAQLERALINFMLDVAAERGYREVLPPFLVNRDAMTGTGQLPKFEGDLFKTVDPEYFLIPTAEVPLTNIHAGEILEERDLPIRYSAYTPCFRREAGSYGKDVKGLIRQHQFNKVELVSFSTPECSYEELERLTSDAEEVLRRLELPYRVVVLCTGDLGFAAAKTYDLEVWVPSQGTYREISSCSNFEEFQARRAEIRFRGSDKKVRHLHTLNGSGLAVGRTVVAILENFQREDGTVAIPNALRPYMKGMERIVKET